MYKTGDSIASFFVKKVEDLPEFRSQGIHLIHQPTGMEVMALQNEDPENLFAFSFKTFPEDSTGVAHILEHSVLSGSKKFPVKDPFLNLLKGSINTFLNAFTFPDKTVYPGASANKKDYYNLMTVYADAVFNPLLKKEVFMQEGHRIQVDQEGNLSRSGIVFNEMKGNYSNPDSIAAEWSLRSVFESGPYSYDSGGDPKYIPNLTYEQFLDFHSTLYHPSNCQLFLYGNIPLAEQLEYLEQEYLSSFTDKKPPRILPATPSWSEPRSIEVPFPASPDADKSRESSVLISWKTAGIQDPVEILSLDVLSELLIGHSGSPLLKALVDSGIGEDLSPVSGLETEVRDTVFTVGLRGMDPQDRDKLQTLVRETLKSIKEEGFSRDAVEGTIQIFEFQHREIKGGPAGLRLMRRALRGWLHGQDPFESTRFTPWMEEVKERFAQNPQYFVEVMEKWLVQNPHYAVITLYPDPELQHRQEEEAVMELKSLKEGLSADDWDKLKKDQEAFEAFQNTPDTPEDLNKIPFLTLDDLPRKVRTLTPEVLVEDPVKITGQRDFTNGIEYTDFVFSLENLDPAFMPWMQLFRKALTGTGTANYTYGQLEEAIRLKTGGLSIYPSIATSLATEEPLSRFFIRLKYLPQYRQGAMELLGDILTSADFSNRKRIKELLLELRNDTKSHVIPAGNSYAANRAASHFNETLRREEEINGISQVFFLDQLSDDLEADQEGTLNRIIQVLTSINKALFLQKDLRINILSQEEQIPQELLRELNAFVKRLPVDPVKASLPPFEGPNRGNKEAWTIPAGVGYVASAIPARKLGQKGYAASLVLSHFLRTGFLWESIRMRGGAYGASANASALEGIFAFSTYRDPQIQSSLEAFVKGLEMVSTGGVSPKDLELAIIGVVGREEHPLGPTEKLMIGYKREALDISDALRQEKRTQILNLKGEDLAEAATFLLNQLDKQSICVISGEELIKNNDVLPEKGWNVALLPL